MKANKFFAIALAALTLVGLGSCKKDKNDAELVLNPTSLKLEVGQTATITANITVESWVSDNVEVATVTGGVVKAIAEGTAVISATAAGQTKNCVVAVVKGGGGGSATLKGNKIWPIVLDEASGAAAGSKIVASFQPNDVDQFLYVWDATYAGVDATGLNFYGHTDGYLAMDVTALGWAGAGFCLTQTGNGWEAAEALRAAIVANPDKYYLHIGIKSTDNYSHCFYIMGSEATKFVLGNHSVYDGPVMADFERDGAWKEFDIPMAQFATALGSTTVAAGVNVFVVLTEGVQGAKLNLDAVYFYEK